MSITTEEQIIWNGKTYHGAEKLGIVDDVFIVSLYPCPPPMPQGGYFTSIPISGKEYRKANGGKSSFSVNETGILLIDDWEKRHQIGCSAEISKRLAQECREWGLPEVTE